MKKKAKLLDGERTRDEIVRDVLRLVEGYLSRLPQTTLTSDGRGVMTWGELHEQVRAAAELMERTE